MYNQQYYAQSPLPTPAHRSPPSKTGAVPFASSLSAKAPGGTIASAQRSVGSRIESANSNLRLLEKQVSALTPPSYRDVEADEFAKSVATAFGQMAFALRDRYQGASPDVSTSRETQWLNQQVKQVSDQVVQLKNEVLRRQQSEQDGARSLQAASLRITELSGRLVAAESQVADLSASVEDLNSRLGRVSIARETHKKAEEAACNEIERLRGVLYVRETVGDEKQRSQRTIAELQSELAKLEEENMAFRERLRTMEGLEARIRPLEEQLEAKRQLELELRQRISMLEAETKSLVDEIERLKAELETALLWQEKYNKVSEEIPGIKAKFREDLARLRSEYDVQILALRKSIEDREVEKLELSKVIKKANTDIESERSAHKETLRILSGTQTELAEVRTQWGKTAADYHRFQDEAMATQKQLLDRMRNQMTAASETAQDKQMRAYVLHIRRLEQQLIDNASAFDNERISLVEQRDVLQRYIDNLPQPDPPMVEDEDVPTVCKRLRQAFDSVPTDPSAVTLLSDSLAALHDLAADNLPNRAQIIKYRALPVVVECLSSTIAAVRMNATGLISVMAGDDEAKSALSSALPSLVNLLAAVGGVVQLYFDLK
eukprot:TRINITY_DN2056_c0_g1_i3.p1 TRINITY_DN2056_c0_g1~~TRINITY_DN2056_c0_g1_i3.p1  ORF type:complete len:606 (+),score=107.45 TRINITY_DN2056_c0_g1_i3:74-1891(+)